MSDASQSARSLPPPNPVRSGTDAGLVTVERQPRFAFGHVSSLWDNRPVQLVICDPDEEGTLVALHFGHDGSDPWFWVSVYVPRPLDAPFVRLGERRWKQLRKRANRA